jgi:DNA invertase Pin-like site-specific DNA recombinase
MRLSIKEKLDLGILITSPIRSRYQLKKSHFIPRPPKKFDDNQAQLIRSKYSPGINSYSQLASEFSTAKATIEHIVRGKGAYKHLNDSSNFTTNW